jgi:hypothetical protein
MPTPRKHENASAKQRAYRERQITRRLEGSRPGKRFGSHRAATARCKTVQAQTLELLCSLKEELQAYWDDRSETWQESERGEAFQNLIEQVEEACSSVENIQTL